MRNVVPQQFTSGGGGGDAPHVLRQHPPDLRRLDEKIHFGNQLRVDDSRGALEKRQVSPTSCSAGLFYRPFSG
jgi:hypothetical protein